MNSLTPKHSVIYDGSVLNIYHANVGEGLPHHDHVYSHLTMCHAGKCKVSNERTSIVMDKDTQPINLIAGEWHEIEALEDGTVFVNVFTVGKY